MKNKKWFHIVVGFVAGFTYVACSSGGGNSKGVNNIASAEAGTGTKLSATDLTGTWKGNVYTSSTVSHPDFTLTLNADGSFACSGFTQSIAQPGQATGTSGTSSDGLKSDDTSWITICQSPVKWEVTKTALRLSYTAISETRVHNFIVLLQDNTTLALNDNGSNYSDTITELTKQ